MSHVFLCKWRSSDRVRSIPHIGQLHKCVKMKMNFRVRVSSTKGRYILDSRIYQQFNDAIAIIQKLSIPNHAFLQTAHPVDIRCFLATFNICKSRSHRLYYGYIGIDIVCFLLEGSVAKREKECNKRAK